MGTRGAWGLLMAHPNIFAGAILSSGATYAQQDALSDIVGIPIRNFYGSEDEDGLEAATVTTMQRYVSSKTPVTRFPLQLGTNSLHHIRMPPL